jgi:hypothetical protein
MAVYLWTGKDRYGNGMAWRVEAASAAQAKAELLSRGCADLTLHTDEVA